jgi:hypothetical protein
MAMHRIVLLLGSVGVATGLPITTNLMMSQAKTGTDTTALPLLVAAPLGPPPAAPPYQTPFQIELMSRVNEEAERAAVAAVPALLERLEDVTFRSALGR